MAKSAPRGPARPRRSLGYWIKSLGVPIALFLVVRTFILEAFHIYPSGSMERTLLIGDFLFPPVHVPGSALMIACAVVVGVLFGWYPAGRVENWTPIEAISGV